MIIDKILRLKIFIITSVVMSLLIPVQIFGTEDEEDKDKVGCCKSILNFLCCNKFSSKNKKINDVTICIKEVNGSASINFNKINNKKIEGKESPIIAVFLDHKGEKKIDEENLVDFYYICDEFMENNNVKDICYFLKAILKIQEKIENLGKEKKINNELKMIKKSSGYFIYNGIQLCDGIKLYVYSLDVGTDIVSCFSYESYEDSFNNVRIKFYYSFLNSIIVNVFNKDNNDINDKESTNNKLKKLLNEYNNNFTEEQNTAYKGEDQRSYNTHLLCTGFKLWKNV